MLAGLMSCELPQLGETRVILGHNTERGDGFNNIGQECNVLDDFDGRLEQRLCVLLCGQTSICRKFKNTPQILRNIGLALEKQENLVEL